MKIRFLPLYFFGAPFVFFLQTTAEAPSTITVITAKQMSCQVGIT
jgi:hypothetical protein